MSKYTLKCYYCGKEDIEPVYNGHEHHFTMNPRGTIDTTVIVRFHACICRECVDIWNNALRELRIPKAEEFDSKKEEKLHEPA